MRVKAMALRILRELKHDKRTIALMLFAPILVLTLVYLVMNGSATSINIGVINAPQSYVENLSPYNVIVQRCTPAQGDEALEKGEVTAIVNMVNGKAYIKIDGSSSANTAKALNALEGAKMQGQAIRSDLVSDITYVYGAEDLEMFDNFGSLLIGFIIFFFVFLIAGISFLRERTTGTLEKLLSTPIKRWEIVCGYVLGFGLATAFQSVVISLYDIYVLDVMMVGSVWLVLLTTMLTAMCALTLGILISTAAENEFQMIQFIPIVVVPQIFFAGLFELAPSWEMVGKIMPLYYVGDALNEVMIKGNGFTAIALDLLVILGCCILFITANVILLKKYRKI